MGALGSAVSTVDAALSGLGTVSSFLSSQKESKEAKKRQRLQQAAIDEQKTQALIERKALIDAQREQQIRGGYSTRGTSTTGIRGTINKETLG